MVEHIKKTMIFLLFSLYLFANDKNQSVIYADWLMFKSDGKPMISGYITDNTKQINHKDYYKITLIDNKIHTVEEFHNNKIVRKNFLKFMKLKYYINTKNGIKCIVRYRQNKVIHNCNNMKYLFMYDNLGNLTEETIYKNNKKIKKIRIYNSKNLCIEYKNNTKKTYECYSYIETKPITVLDDSLKNKQDIKKLLYQLNR